MPRFIVTIKDGIAVIEGATTETIDRKFFDNDLWKGMPSDNIELHDNNSATIKFETPEQALALERFINEIRAEDIIVEMRTTIDYKSMLPKTTLLEKTTLNVLNSPEQAKLWNALEESAKRHASSFHDKIGRYTMKYNRLAGLVSVKSDVPGFAMKFLQKIFPKKTIKESGDRLSSRMEIKTPDELNKLYQGLARSSNSNKEGLMDRMKRSLGTRLNGDGTNSNKWRNSI
jgi:hypothetical protein